MKKLMKAVLFNLPEGRPFDTWIALASYWIAHGRVPSASSGLFNDYLFRVKCSAEIDLALRQFVSDKESVKLFYRAVLGEDLAPRTLVKFHSPDEFSEQLLPERCVLKPTHLSGCIFYDRTQRPMSNDELARVRSWFAQNLYRQTRERNYKNLRPLVIAEEVVASSSDIRDYKVFCFRGQPKAIQVDVGRHVSHKRRMYTPDWEPLPYRYNKPLAEREERPAQLEKALEIAARIAGYFEFIRVDFFILEDRLFLGELTSVPENAHGRFESKEAELEFSRLVLS
jgi:hypothetical protein